MDVCRDTAVGTPDYWEDALTMRRLTTINKSLMKKPPTHWMVAAYLKYEAPDGNSTSNESADDLPEASPLYEP